MDQTERIFWLLVGAGVILFIAFKLIDKWKAKWKARRK